MDFAQGYHPHFSEYNSAKELIDAGFSQDDVRTLITIQNQQRDAGRTPQSLRVLAGLGDNQCENKTHLVYTPAPQKEAKKSQKRGGLHITRVPVWAQSIQAHTVAELDARQTLTKEAAKKLKAGIYKIFDKRTALLNAKRNGKDLTSQQMQITGISHIARDLLLNVIDGIHRFKGNCVPSYEVLMKWAGCSHRTVHRTIIYLNALGLLDWSRRYNYTKDAKYGARSTQTSNLYRVSIPHWIAKLVGISAPVPVDTQARREADQEQHWRMLQDTSYAERKSLIPDDKEHRAAYVFAGLRATMKDSASLKSHECHNGTEPLSNHYKDTIRRKGIALDEQCVCPDGL